MAKHMKMKLPIIKNLANKESIFRLFKVSLILIVATLYLHIFFEWIFFITKPSFFSMLSFQAKLLVLVIAPLPFVLIAFGIQIIFLLLYLLLNLISRIVSRSYILKYGMTFLFLFPSLVLTCTVFLLLDNFSYTVLKFGVITFSNYWRLTYALFFSALFIYIFIKVAHKSLNYEGRLFWPVLSSTTLIFISIFCTLLVMLGRHGDYKPGVLGYYKNTGKLPDIFLISGDGLQASEITGYGNPISESSHLTVLGEKAVVFENFFTNTNRTAGSIPTFLTGKYATTTYKMNMVHKFTGKDSYQHLPGLLRELGYLTIQFGLTTHVDSFAWNMRNSFEFSSAQKIKNNLLEKISDKLGRRLNWELYFNKILVNRIWDRLLHSFGSELMQQPPLLFQMPTLDNNKRKMRDRNFVSTYDFKAMTTKVIAFMDKNQGPVFVQMHASKRLGIEHFNNHFNEIVNYLRENDRFEDALIIATSDHGWNYTWFERLPLIIKFPVEVEIPDTSLNTQAIDIAPTILDYLGIPIPAWMEGRSLIKPIDKYYPITSVESSALKVGLVLKSMGEPAMGGAGAIGMIICNKIYRLDLYNGTISTDFVEGYTPKCKKNKLPSNSKAKALLINHLKERGFAVELIPFKDNV